MHLHKLVFFHTYITTILSPEKCNLKIIVILNIIYESILYIKPYWIILIINSGIKYHNFNKSAMVKWHNLNAVNAYSIEI